MSSIWNHTEVWFPTTNYMTRSSISTLLQPFWNHRIHFSSNILLALVVRFSASPADILRGLSCEGLATSLLKSWNKGFFTSNFVPETNDAI